MSFPTSEPIPPPEEQDLSRSRRRRKKRMIVPDMDSQRTQYLEEFAHQVIPSFDFFLYSLLSALVLIIAILVDSPALYLSVILLAPFMAPIIGLSLATIIGSTRFFFQAMGSISIGSLIIFLGGLIAGWVMRFLPEHHYQQALLHAHFSFPDIIILTIGAALTVYLLARSPKQRPLLPSVAVAYELYLPLGVSAFGLTSGIPNLFPNGLVVYLIHLTWSILIGALVLAIIGMRPLTMFGYALGTSVIIICMTTLITASGIGIIAKYQMPTPTPSYTYTPTYTPTRFLSSTPTQIPTRTFSLTPSITHTTTPIPPSSTPVYAIVNTDEGFAARIRTEPSQKADVGQTVPDGTLLEVFEIIQNEGITWAHVRLPTDGTKGWIMRNLISTATPAPGR